MRTKLYWALCGFIVLFVIGAVVMYIDQSSDYSQFDKEKAELDRLLEKRNQLRQGPIPEQEKTIKSVEYHPQRPHFHKDGTYHDPSNTVPLPKKVPGGLTFHAELLETNPVEALRLQSVEREHWSSEHIPPFPPDDQEAAALAYNIYLMIHYIELRDTTNPVFIKAWNDKWAILDTIFDKYPGLPPYTEKHYSEYTEAELDKQKVIDARRNDLSRLTLPQIEDPPPLLHRMTSTFTK